MPLQAHCRAVFAIWPALMLGSVAQAVAEVPAVVIPRLPAYGVSAQALIPEGWRAEQQLFADFNADGRKDVLMVLRMASPQNVLKDPGGDLLGMWPLNTNPRILMAAFGRRAGGYQLAFQSRVIPRHVQANMDDPFSSLTLRASGFLLTLGAFFNAGSWTTTSTTFNVRFQNGCFRVIGYDSFEIHRGTQNSTAVSVNYLTGRVKISTEEGQSGQAESTWSTLGRRGSICIQDVGNGLEFDPLK